MTYIVQFFAMMLTALFIENIIFTRAFGTSWLLHIIRNPKELFTATALLTVITTVSSVIGYPLRRFADESELSYVLVPMLYMGCIAVTYIIVDLVMKKFMQKLFKKVYGTLGAASFNCAVLGALLVPTIERLDLLSTIGYSFGMSLGFAFAVLIMGVGMERIRFCHVPKAFKGLPITLIYLGLLSLAFYGLIGHQLPT